MTKYDAEIYKYDAYRNDFQKIMFFFTRNLVHMYYISFSTIIFCLLVEKQNEIKGETLWHCQSPLIFLNLVVRNKTGRYIFIIKT